MCGGKARAAFSKLFFFLGVARHERAFYFLRPARGLNHDEGREAECVGAVDKARLEDLSWVWGVMDGREGSTPAGGGEGRGGKERE